jgi:ribosomal protein S8E
MKNIFLLLPFLLVCLNVFSQTEPRLVLPVGHTSTLMNLDISFDEKYIIFSSFDGSISLWDYKNEKLLKKFIHTSGKSVKCKFIKNSYEFISYTDAVFAGQIDNSVKIWSIDQEEQPIKFFDFSKHITKNIRGITFTQDKDIIILETPNRFNDSLIFFNIRTDEIKKTPRIKGFSDIIAVFDNRIVIETVKIDENGSKMDNNEIIAGLTLQDFDGKIIDFFPYEKQHENIISSKAKERLNLHNFPKKLKYEYDQDNYFIDSFFTVKIVEDHFKKEFLIENKFTKTDSCYYFEASDVNELFYTIQNNLGQKHYLFKNGRLKEIFKDEGLKILMKYQNIDFGESFNHFFYSIDSSNYFLYQNKLYKNGSGSKELQKSKGSISEYQRYFDSGYFHLGNGKFFFNDESNIKMFDFEKNSIIKEFKNSAIFQNLKRIGENYFLYTSYLSYETDRRFQLLKNDLTILDIDLSFLGVNFHDEIVQINDSIIIAVDSNVIHRINVVENTKITKQYSSFFDDYTYSKSNLFYHKDLILYSTNLNDIDSIIVFKEKDLELINSFQGSIIVLNSAEDNCIIQSKNTIFSCDLTSLKLSKKYPNYQLSAVSSNYFIDSQEKLVLPKKVYNEISFDINEEKNYRKYKNPPIYSESEICSSEKKIKPIFFNKDWVYYQVDSLIGNNSTYELKAWNREKNKNILLSNGNLDFVSQINNNVYFVHYNENNLSIDSIFIYKQTKNKIKFLKAYSIPDCPGFCNYWSFKYTPKGLLLISNTRFSLMDLEVGSIIWTNTFENIEENIFNSSVLYLSQRIAPNEISLSYVDFNAESSFQIKQLTSKNIIIPEDSYASFTSFNNSLGGILSYSTEDKSGLWSIQKHFWVTASGITDFATSDKVVRFSKNNNFILLENSYYNCSTKVFTSLPSKWVFLRGELEFINDTLLTDGHAIISILDSNFMYYTHKSTCQPITYNPSKIVYLDSADYLQYEKNNSSARFYRIDYSGAKIHKLFNGKLVYLFNNQDTSYAIFAELEKNNKKYGFQKKTYLSLANLNTGKTEGKIEMEVFEDFNTSFFKFNSKNQTIYYHPFNGKIFELDFKTFTIKNIYQGHRDWISGFNFYNDSIFVTTSADYNLHVWKNNQTKPLYSRIQVGENDFLYYDEHYRFDGTPGAIEKLYFVCGLEVVELNQIKDSLYVPNLVQRIMNGENLYHLPKLSELNICGVTPVVEPLDNDKSGKQGYRIIPRSGGVGDVDLYINGVVRLSTNAKKLKRKDGNYMLYVEKELLELYQITGEELQVKVIAKTANNSISSRGVVIDIESDEKTTFKKPSLHAIMIGVDDYKGDGLDLNYAAKDANDLQIVLQKSAQKFFNIDDTSRVHFYNLTVNRSGANGNEKIKGITPDRTNIINTIAEIEKTSKPEDILLLFFAGHGEIVDKDQLLLLTSESSREDFKGLRMRELLELLNKVPAGKRVLILDACHSGAAINNLDMAQLTGKRDVKDAERQSQRLKELDKLASKSGFAIITASSSDQKALELPQYEHGLMTYALLNSMLNNKNALDEDNKLQLEKWLMATEEEVRKLNANQSAERMVPINFTLGKVDDEVRSSIVLKEIPLVYVKNVINTDLAFDNLEIETKLNEYFSNRTRGGDKSLLLASVDQTNANLVNILYTKEKSIVNLKIIILKNNQVNKQFTKTGAEAQLNELIKEIALEIEAGVK